MKVKRKSIRDMTLLMQGVADMTVYLWFVISTISKVVVKKVWFWSQVANHNSGLEIWQY